MKKLTGHKEKSVETYFSELLDFSKKNTIDYDLYGNGDFLNTFENEVADTVGMEAGMFLPSGVMAQLIAIKTWGDEQSSNVFACHESCHLIKHEENSYKELLKFDAEIIGTKNKVPKLIDLKHLSKQVSTLIYELPMRHLGGDLPSFEELEEIKVFCNKRGIKFHIDGARIFETKGFYNRTVKEIVNGADSLFISFYKGFGSTSGSMLFGSKSFIKDARRWLRRFGGDLYQQLPLVVSAKMNYIKRIDSFSKWNQKAQEVAKELSSRNKIKIFPYPPKVNMFHALLPISEKELRERCLSIDNSIVRLGIWGEESPGVTRIEFTVGDGTLEFSNIEISEIFKSLVD